MRKVDDGPVVLRERGARALVGVYVLATVLALILWAVLQWGVRRPSWVELLFGVFNVPLSHSLVSFVVLALITRALVGRKRVGLAAAAAFQLLGMYLGVVALARLTAAPALSGWESRRLLSTGLDVASLLIGAVILVALWRLRPAFPGHLQSGSWVRLVAALAVGGALTMAVTWVLLSVTDKGTTGSEWTQLLTAFARSLGDVDVDTVRELAGVPSWIPQLTAVMVSATLITAVVLFLRSASTPTRWSPSREIAIRTLLSRFGSGDSLGYFATRRDKSSIFSADGQAAISYRVNNGVSLASGDPVGDPAAWPAAIREWKSEARFYGWVPAVVSASEAGARAYADAGLLLIEMGDEAILHVDRFSLSNTSLSAVRRPLAVRNVLVSRSASAGRAKYPPTNSPGSSTALPSGRQARLTAGSRWLSTGWPTPATAALSWSPHTTRLVTWLAC